jgi:uroporphyrinogen-III synthase
VSAGGDGGDLARLVAERFGPGRTLLYLAGDDRARDLAAELAPHGVLLETVVIYRARAAAGFPPDVAAALQSGACDGVLHYSRRSTAIFVDCVRAARSEAAAARLKHFCLSARAAEPLAEIGARSVLIAQHPDETAMLALVTAS